MSNNKIYEFIGRIIVKNKDKVYNKKSPHYGNTYYRLTVKLEDNQKVKEFLVFPSSKVWPLIERADYVGKKYYFYCSGLVSNYAIVSYQLVDWEELDSKKSKKNGSN